MRNNNLMHNFMIGMFILLGYTGILLQSHHNIIIILSITTNAASIVLLGISFWFGLINEHSSKNEDKDQVNGFWVLRHLSHAAERISTHMSLLLLLSSVILFVIGILI